MSRSLEGYFINDLSPRYVFSLLVLFLFVFPPLNTMSAIDRIMLSGADSRKLGYQTRNCIYSLRHSRYRVVESAIARRPRRRRGDRRRRRRRKIKWSYRNPVSLPLFHSPSSQPRYVVRVRFGRRLFFWPTGWVKSVEKKSEFGCMMRPIVNRGSGVATFNTRNVVKWQTKRPVK